MLKHGLQAGTISPKDFTWSKENFASFFKSKQDSHPKGYSQGWDELAEAPRLSLLGMGSFTIITGGWEAYATPSSQNRR